MLLGTVDMLEDAAMRGTYVTMVVRMATTYLLEDNTWCIVGVHLVGNEGIVSSKATSNGAMILDECRHVAQW